MMKPIYFPFTTITESAAGVLWGLLGKFVVFQPIRELMMDSLRACEEKGWVEVMTPWAGEEERLMAFFKDAKEWGRIHHGAVTSLKAAFESGVYNQSFVSQIRSDIIRDKVQTPEPTNSGFLSRLFLLMAQDLDVRQMEIDQDLASSIHREQELFSQISGEEKISDPSRETLSQSDAGAYMTIERLSAWFRLLATAGSESAFLVTDSEAAAKAVLDRFNPIELIAFFDGISCRQPEEAIQELNRMVAHLALSPWAGVSKGEAPRFSSGDGAHFSLALYIVPGSVPGALNRFFQKIDDQEKPHENKYLNTIIGVLGPPGKKT